MCLIAFAWRADPEYPLVVAGNRDEFFARPTASATWWEDGRRLAGRDLRAGGTWMGVSRDGRFAALTNHRDPGAQRADAPSRGALAGDVLDAQDLGTTLARIGGEAARFNGFNLLAARWTGPDAGLWIVSSPGDATPTAVAPGVHGLSNARLDTSWPKVDLAVERTRDALRDAAGTDDLVGRLFAMLADRHVAADDSLPSTGVSLEVEQALSAAFIRMRGYGTRSSTVFVVDRTGRATFVERRFEPDLPMEERHFEFGPGDEVA